MDKQQFDHIENRIRQSTEEISVLPSEEAWNKMELLLDKEFKKERRRRGAWWWFFLLIGLISGTGLYFYHITTPNRNRKTAHNQNSTERILPSITIKQNEIHHPIKEIQKVTNTVADNGSKKNTPLTSRDQIARKQSEYLSSAPDKKDLLTNGNIKHEKKSRTLVPVSLKTQNAKSGIKQPRSLNKITNVKKGSVAPNEISRNDNYSINSSEESSTSHKVVKPLNTTDSLNLNKNAVVDSSQSAVSTIVKKSSTQTVDSVLINDRAKSASIKLQSGAVAVKGLYYLISIAGDRTDVKKFTNKELNPVYGFGLGYRFNKRISLQTGFYTGKKIYTAGPQDYKVGAGSYIAKIISASAVCSIYDIPLTVKYDIVSRNRYNLYFTTGLSSYILKRETYDMHFYNPMGSYRRMSYTYKDNKNFLSVLNVSVGFEHRLSDAFYIQAEPYFKLPISGVGEGDVKLYSAGLQLGIKYQPLKNRKNK